MSETELETYDVPCFCGCDRVERFGGHFVCMACGAEIDPEAVRLLVHGPPEP